MRLDVTSKAELAEVEDQIDDILKAELAKTAKGDKTAVDPGILSLAAHSAGVLDVCRA
jgi:hypothetical protein